jgi:ketose-bisphosphate aldolase
MKKTFKEQITLAFNSGYAIPSISVSNLETIYGALEAAHEKHSPIILQIAPIQLLNQEIIFCEFKALVEVLSKRFSEVPYLLHLDHADTIADCKKAIDAGFDSVMFDGSAFPFDKNMAYTKTVRDYHGEIGLEAELGALNPEDGEGSISTKENTHFTDPKQAKVLIDAVKVDALAISFGNAHGFYQSKPNLDFDLLKTIRKTTNTALVLHGGSGLSKDDIQRAIKQGISKINFFTQCDVAYRNAFCESAKKDQYMMVGEKAAKNAFKECVKTCIDVCMSGGKL